MSQPFTGYLIPADATKPMRRVELSGDVSDISNTINATYFDCLAVRPDVDFFVDDEALLVESPHFNARASLLYDWEMGRQRGFAVGAQIFGDVLVTGGVDNEGSTVSISNERVAEYTTFLTDC